MVKTHHGALSTAELKNDFNNVWDKKRIFGTASILKWLLPEP